MSRSMPQSVSLSLSVTSTVNPKGTVEGQMGDDDDNDDDDDDDDDDDKYGTYSAYKM